MSLGWGGGVAESDPEMRLLEILVSCGAMSFWPKFDLHRVVYMFEKACPPKKLVSWGTIQTQHVASDSFPGTGSVFLGGFWNTQAPVYIYIYIYIIHQGNFSFFSARKSLVSWGSDSDATFVLRTMSFWKKFDQR